MTDAWQQFRSRFAGIIARGNEEKADTTSRRLEQIRNDISSAPADQVELIQARHVDAWRTRIIDTLEDHPDLAVALGDFVKEVELAGIYTHAVTPSNTAGHLAVSADAR